MIKILKYILIIFILVLIGDRTLFYALDNIQSKSYSGFLGKINKVMTATNPYDGLILGSSRASRHISPDILDGNYYNLGSDGMESSYHLGLIEILKAKKKLPKQVILVIDEKEILSDQYVNDINHLAVYYDVPYVKEEINNLGFSERFKFLFKSYRFNGKLPSLIRNGLFTQSKSTGDGYLPLKKSKTSLERVKVLLEANNLNAGNKIRPNVLENYKKLIVVLKASSVDVYVTFMPSLYEISNEQKSIFDDFIKALDCEYIDLQNAGVNNLKYWEDLVHLNEEGAIKISKEIKRLLELK